MPDNYRTPEIVSLPLKVAILTTRTPHHVHFMRELNRQCSDFVELGLVLIETKPFPYKKFFFRHIVRNWYNPLQWLLLNPYLNIPYKSNEQRDFELREFFCESGLHYDSDDGIPKVEVRNVNAKYARQQLIEYGPDLILVYGTGLVSPEVFNIASITAINCHGGWLPDYRGSDTNLWAVIRSDFDKLGLAWHKVDATFDTGPIFMMERVAPRADLDYVSLRYYTTLLATDMCVRLLKKIAKGNVETQVQSENSKDRNLFRFMPYVLKWIADYKLKRHFGGRFMIWS